MSDQNVIRVNFSAAGDAPPLPKITVNKQAGTVAFGKQNDFPQQIMDLSKASPVNDAIIRQTVTFVKGRGVYRGEGFAGTPYPGGNWDTVIERCATDLKTFGGFYLQVIPNKDSATVSVYHQDFTEVRIGEINELNEIQNFVLAKDWPKGDKKKRVTVGAWKGLSESKPGEAYIYYYYSYTPGLSNYCVPDWFAALEYVRADGQLAKFYNKSIRTGFTPSVILTMPSNPSKEVKAQFQDDMERAFTGPEAETAIVTLWGESSGIAPKVEPFNASANADVYNNVEAIVFQKLISAHRLPSPTLAGVSGSGNLSGNAAEIVDSYILYNYSVVEEMRSTILAALNELRALGGFEPLEIEDLGVTQKIRESKNADAVEAAGGVDEALAARLGVSGTQALTAILENTNISDDDKRAMCAVIFGLSDEELNKLFADKKRPSRLAKFFKWKL